MYQKLFCDDNNSNNSVLLHPQRKRKQTVVIVYGYEKLKLELIVVNIWRYVNVDGWCTLYLSGLLLNILMYLREGVNIELEGYNASIKSCIH